MVSLLGYIGITLSLIAYLPQAIHLIKRTLLSRLSIKTYALWIVSSCLLLAQAVLSHTMIFALQQKMNLFAVTSICLFGLKYKNGRCGYHKSLR